MVTESKAEEGPYLPFLGKFLPFLAINGQFCSFSRVSQMVTAVTDGPRWSQVVTVGHRIGEGWVRPLRHPRASTLFAMPTVYATLASVVDAGRVVRVDDGVLRSTCPGTLAERAEELRALAAPAMEAITKGAPRWSLDFKGDAQLPEALKVELEEFFRPHRTRFAELLRDRKIKMTRLTDASKAVYVA